MIRVLYVSTSTTLGGAEKTLYTLATCVDPNRFKLVGVVSLKPPGVYAQKLKDLGVPTFTLDVKGRPAFADIGRLAEIFRDTRPDVVHAFMYQAIQLCRLAKRREPFVRLISSPRVHYRSRGTATLLVDRLLKRYDDRLISECKSSRDYLIRRLGYPPHKVQVIYNGIDIAGWPSSRLERQKKRLELRLNASDLLIGSAGRLDEQKGQRYLIDAIARLKGRAVRCAILGEGPLRGELEARIRRSHLERSVWLPGEQSDVVSWLYAFDVFVLPSLWEGLPNALLEAMALGLPVVATAVDGVREVVAEGKTGLLAPPANAAALARRIGELADDPAKRERLGAAARQSVTERFSLIEMISSYEKAYAEVHSA